SAETATSPVCARTAAAQGRTFPAGHERQRRGARVENFSEEHGREAIIAPNPESPQMTMSEPTTPTPPPAQSATQPPARQRGCFFYGCITLLTLVLVMGVAGFFVARHLLNKFVAFAEQ